MLIKHLSRSRYQRHESLLVWSASCYNVSPQGVWMYACYEQRSMYCTVEVTWSSSTSALSTSQDHLDNMKVYSIRSCTGNRILPVKTQRTLVNSGSFILSCTILWRVVLFIWFHIWRIGIYSTVMLPTCQLLAIQLIIMEDARLSMWCTPLSPLYTHTQYV